MVDLPRSEYEERVERARLAREEARKTIDEQTKTLSDIDEKAIQIFRINLLISSVMISGLSISVSTDQTSYSDVMTNYTILGSALLLLSILLASITYTSTSERIGISKGSIDDSILNQRYDYDLVEEQVAVAYGNMIRYNYKKNAANALLFTLTLLAAITSISYLTLGIVDVYNSVPLYANIAVIVFLGVFIKFSGLVGTTKRWYQLTSPVKRFTNLNVLQHQV
ncbi:hypothetical protein [Halostagnicola sp. A56]|uniref:hypothetical protein n=1 Tax=Halostagnicola sp. A56 TaxID=1495067 RepID=UPI0012E1C776|nr:hypothetical protein [Halostagnicola sp. A56]